VLGRQNDRVGAEDRVDPGGEDFDALRGTVHGEAHHGAGGAADPVPLHGPDAFRPPVEAVDLIQQLFGVIGDLDVPLGQLLLGDGAAVAPATAVDHLLVGQNSLADVAPVDQAVLFVHQSPLVHLQEKPLVPAVVLGQAGGGLTRPVVAEPQPFHLRLHKGDVVERPFLGVDTVFDGGIFRRQAEGVPADGVQDVESVHPLEAAKGVTDAVVADMPHVQPAGRVGKHFQNVVLGPVTAFGGAIDLVLIPACLPFLFDVPKWVYLRHDTTPHPEGRIKDASVALRCK